jgi:hypothetical protein
MVSDCGDPFCRESSTFPIQPGGEEPVFARALARFPRAGFKGSLHDDMLFSADIKQGSVS